MGATRIAVAKKLCLANPNEYKFLWVTEFPMYEYNDDGSLVAMHHPFTAYIEEDEKYIERALFVICKNEAINIYRKKKRDMEYVVSMTYSSEDSEMDEIELRDMSEDIEIKGGEHCRHLVKVSFRRILGEYNERGLFFKSFYFYTY